MSQLFLESNKKIHLWLFRFHLAVDIQFYPTSFPKSRFMTHSLHLLSLAPALYAALRQFSVCGDKLSRAFNYFHPVVGYRRAFLVDTSVKVNASFP